jgi:ubiquinone biosynthesis protein COQ9
LHYAGDTSSDMDWYGIRAKVISIFVASELFMLTDKSTDYKETMDFVDRRVAQLKDFDDSKNDYFAFATSLYLAKNSLIEMLKAPVVSEEFMEMRRGVREEKGEGSKDIFCLQ